MRLKLSPAGDRKIEQAAQLASVLAGAWRNSPPPWHGSPATLAQLGPLLVRSNAAGLGWRRLRHSPLRTTGTARELRRIGQLMALDNARQEAMIEQVIGLLRAEGIDPILIKGWSVARHYADPGTRPYGDIDLCVPPNELASAMDVVRHAEGIRGMVDLHRGVPDLPDRSWEEVYARSRTAPLCRTDVRVLGAEDELRLLGLHLVRHSGWRPHWLCDVAAALENQPAEFDWDYCFRGDRRLSGWVRCVVGLAHQLLGAKIGDATPEKRIASPFIAPTWFARTVLWQWGTAGEKQTLARQLAKPREALQTLLYDWLNPIKALFRMQINPCRWHADFLTPAIAVIARLVLFAARLKRFSEKTWHPQPKPPFELHRESVM